MKIVLIVVFILTACGLFLLLSGILKLPTLRTGRAMMQSGKKEKKLQKTLDAFYMDGAAYLGKYIGMNTTISTIFNLSLPLMSGIQSALSVL